METAISFDWSKNYNDDGEEKYRNLGREALLNSCKHKFKGVGFTTEANENNYCEKCDISGYSAIPMINYLYPVCGKYGGYSDEKILRVVKETNLTLVEDNESGELFLTLCGGGMNLSQDIALAYYILAHGPCNMIPCDILKDMSLQPELSISLKDFVQVTRQGKKELKNEIRYLQEKLKAYKIANREARIKLKARQTK